MLRFETIVALEKLQVTVRTALVVANDGLANDDEVLRHFEYMIKDLADVKKAMTSTYETHNSTNSGD